MKNTAALKQDLDTNSSDVMIAFNSGPRLQEFKFTGLDNLITPAKQSKFPGTQRSSISRTIANQDGSVQNLTVAGPTPTPLNANQTILGIVAGGGTFRVRAPSLPLNVQFQQFESTK